jgi:hypothetical protein
MGLGARSYFRTNRNAVLAVRAVAEPTPTRQVPTKKKIVDMASVGGSGAAQGVSHHARV